MQTDLRLWQVQNLPWATRASTTELEIYFLMYLILSSLLPTTPKMLVLTEYERSHMWPCAVTALHVRISDFSDRVSFQKSFTFNVSFPCNLSLILDPFPFPGLHCLTQHYCCFILQSTHQFLYNIIDSHCHSPIITLQAQGKQAPLCFDH